MGIKGLMQLLNEECPGAIKELHEVTKFYNEIANL